MRYFLLIAVLLSLWMLVQEFLLSDRSEEGLDTFGAKLRDLGKRLHVVFGIMAVLIVVYLLVRVTIKYFIPE